MWAYIRYLAGGLIGLLLFGAAVDDVSSRQEAVRARSDQELPLEQIELLRPQWLDAARQCNAQSLLAMAENDPVDAMAGTFDLEELRRLYQTRLDNGHLDAATSTRITLQNVGPTDEFTGARLIADLIALAEAGSGTAQNEVGLAYLRGDFELEQDFMAAQAWFTRAIQGGDRLGAVWLGRMYLHGVARQHPDDPRTYIQAGTDALLFSASQCEHSAMFLIQPQLLSPMTYPFDQELAQRFYNLVPYEMPNLYWTPPVESVEDSDKGPDIDPGHDEERQGGENENAEAGGNEIP